MEFFIFAKSPTFWHIYCHFILCRLGEKFIAGGFKVSVDVSYYVQIALSFQIALYANPVIVQIAACTKKFL